MFCKKDAIAMLYFIRTICILIFFKKEKNFLFDPSNDLFISPKINKSRDELSRLFLKKKRK